MLPIKFHIHCRQLSFLHRILNLEETDPVYQMWVNLRSFSECGEGNWWTDVSFLLHKYDITETLEEIQAMSKESFKKIVKDKVVRCAMVELLEDCHSKTKTRNINYSSFKLQSYLCEMFPSASRIAFQCRSQTVDIKSHRSYKYKDLTCRRCKDADETLHHVMNCGYSEVLDFDFSTSSEHWDMVAANRCIRRIGSFVGEFS